MYYAHQYLSENTFQVAKYFDDGSSQNVSPDDPNYRQWIAAGNTPKLETRSRFLSIVDGKVIVDPNKQSILAKEEAERSDNQTTESLIQSKMRELAITALKAEGKLDKDGKAKK